jgi:predicted Zn-dependent protease
LEPWVLLGWGSLTGLTIAAIWPGPTARLRRIGAALAWLVAAPWIVVPLNQPFAEHRLYAPLVGLAAIACAVAPRLRAVRLPVRVLQLAGAVAVLLGIVCSANRSLLYRDERALWRAELARHPTSFRAWWGLGTATLRAGDVAGSIEPLANAHALHPAHFDAHSNLCEALVSLPDQQAEPRRALAVAAQVAALSPGDPWVRTMHARACLQAGRVLGDRDAFANAEEIALSCLQIATPKGYVYRLAASARRGLGDLEGALAHLDASIARGLAPPEVRLDRAAVLRDLGRTADAQRELIRAQREAPMEPAVLHALQQLSAPPK